ALLVGAQGDQRGAQAHVEVAVVLVLGLDLLQILGQVLLEVDLLALVLHQAEQLLGLERLDAGELDELDARLGALDDLEGHVGLVRRAVDLGLEVDGGVEEALLAVLVDELLLVLLELEAVVGVGRFDRQFVRQGALGQLLLALEDDLADDGLLGDHEGQHDLLVGAGDLAEMVRDGLVHQRQLRADALELAQAEQGLDVAVEVRAIIKIALAGLGLAADGRHLHVLEADGLDVADDPGAGDDGRGRGRRRGGGWGSRYRSTGRAGRGRPSKLGHPRRTRSRRRGGGSSWTGRPTGRRWRRRAHSWMRWSRSRAEAQSGPSQKRGSGLRPKKKAPPRRGWPSGAYSPEG